MAQEPTISQLMIRYPFSPHSRRFFEMLPVQESFASEQVLGQAELRLLTAIGKISRYEPHISELTEFSSFFVAVLVAGQDAYLTQKFAEREGDSARRFFLKERPTEKPTIFRECFGVRVDAGGKQHDYGVGVEDYLSVFARFELGRIPRWRLANQPLSMGVVRLGDNGFNDLFGALAERAIADGVKNVRRGQFPRELVGVRDRIVPHLPPQMPKPKTGFLYIDELLKHPVSDGRHRFTWLVLAPYLVNVKNLGDEEAIEKIQSFVSAKGEPRGIKRFIEYNVKRVKRNGLMPPSLNKLRMEHPDLYALLPSEITQRFRGKQSS